MQVRIDSMEIVFELYLSCSSTLPVFGGQTSLGVNLCPGQELFRSVVWQYANYILLQSYHMYTRKDINLSLVCTEYIFIYTCIHIIETMYIYIADNLYLSQVICVPMDTWSTYAAWTDGHRQVNLSCSPWPSDLKGCWNPLLLRLGPTLFSICHNFCWSSNLLNTFMHSGIVVMWENWIVALFALRHWKLLFFFFADEFCRDFEVQPFHMNHLSYIYDAMSKWTTRNLFDVSIVRSQQRDLVAIRSRHPLHSHVVQFREGIICFCLL